MVPSFPCEAHRVEHDFPVEHDYRSPHRPSTALGQPQQPEHCIDWVVPFHVSYERAKNRPFFQPAKSHTSGWQWLVDDDLPDALRDELEAVDSEALKVICAELQLRAADALGCEATHVAFVLAPPDTALAHARLLMYETVATGLAKDCLRLMAQLAQPAQQLVASLDPLADVDTGQWKLSQPGRLDELRDSDLASAWKGVMKGENASLGDSAREGLRWLQRSWRFGADRS